MTDFNLENIINHKISMLSILMRRQVLKIIANNKLKITPEQWVIMFYLWQENGLSIGEIANRSNKDFANVTRIVDKLIKMKYVIKEKSKKDGRSFQVYIQPEADIIKNDIQNCWKQASDIALHEISLAQHQQLITLLDKIESNILADLE